jgi:hypothetical protein
VNAALWLLVAMVVITGVVAAVIFEEQRGRWQAKGRR